MRRWVMGFVVLLVVAAGLVRPVGAIYSFIDEGQWPQSWPAELAPLRKQARTLEGPMGAYLHYAINCQNREEFEAAWPHLLKLKSERAPVFLVRGENFFLRDGGTAGVVVHCPPSDSAGNVRNRRPIENVSNPRTHWMNATTIELVVDGDVVDLNRIRLPSDGPIVDERFEKN